MIRNFLAYELAIELHSQCEAIKAKHHIKEQLNRAVLSIALNLAEGSGKPTNPEKRRYYAIAFGSVRETQAILQLVGNEKALALSDRLGGMVYRLVNPKQSVSG